MARQKSERARSKAQALDDLTQSIEQFQDFLSKLEDLGREGFPYLEGARARVELQFRECLKRAFGEKSSEFQTHRQHKLSSDTKQTVNLVRTLIASLEEKKLELQGLKPAVSEEAAIAAEPTRPHLTLVPPPSQTAQATVTPAATAVPPPVTTAVPLSTNIEMAPAAVAPVAAAPPSPVQPAAPTHPVTPPAEVKPQRAPIEPISSLFRTQEIKPQAPASPPAHQPGEVPPPSPARFSTTQEVHVRPPSPVPSPGPQASSPRASAPLEVNHLNVTKTLCQRFHFVARQLRLRGEYRTTLNVEDEFDVQDLLHALLRLQFDDISTDEWTPSYSNGAPRTTFLLNQDRLAVVVKKTRTGLSAKDLSDQVRADIERYRGRGRCMYLFCFIYDPEGRIASPKGLESDLASTSEHFTVDVLVAPK
jgi:hypothetical protein